MTNEQKVLRQAENQVQIIGIVNENNLEIREFNDRQNPGQKYNAITGELTINVAENENHRVRFFSKELRNDGQPNGQFAGLKTIMDTVVSVADLGENPDAQPTKVRVTGSLELNEYYGQDGQLRSRVQVQGRFVNRLEAGDPTEHKATFDIEGVVQRLVDEFDRQTGEETGRKKVTLVVPGYQGRVEPMEFTLEGQGADYAEDHFTNGTSINIVGNIVNFRKVTVKKVEMGFGSKTEEKVEFNEERLVVSGGVYEEGIHDAKIFDVDLIKEALVQRNVYLEQLKTESEQRNQQAKPQGFGAATTTAPKTNIDKAPEVDVSNLF